MTKKNLMDFVVPKESLNRPCELCAKPDCSAVVIGDDEFGKTVDLCNQHYNEYILRIQKEMRDKRRAEGILE